MSFEPIRNAMRINLGRFEKSLRAQLNSMKDCEEKVFTDYWDRRLTGDLLSELYYASGTSTITSTGKFVINGHGIITGTVTHRWHDPYDWHGGLGAYIPGFGVIADSDALRLKNSGRAAEFNMESIWSQTVTYDKYHNKFIWSMP